MTQKVIVGVWRDAQQLAKDHPDTFEVPSAEQLAAIKVGDYVKVCPVAAPERFWLQVTEVKGNGVFVGRIDNDLLFTDGHDLAIGLLVQFEAKNAYDVLGEHAS